MALSAIDGPRGRRGPGLHLFEFPHWLNQLWLGAITVLAFWKGSWRERAIASSQVLCTLLNRWLVCNAACWAQGGPDHMLTLFVAEDLIVLAVCVGSAWRANRYWTIVAASIALAYLATDVVTVVSPAVTKWAFLSAQIFWFYALMTTVLWGVWTTARDRRAANALRAPAAPSHGSHRDSAR